MTQMPTTPLYWTCPGCKTRILVPTPPRGIIECPPDDFSSPEKPCGKHAYDLDSAGLGQVTVVRDVDPPSSPQAPPRLAGDCEGCTPEEAREFEARFPLLDEIDREFRTRDADA